jgi:hypothetical protein
MFMELWTDMQPSEGCKATAAQYKDMQRVSLFHVPEEMFH